MIRNATKILIIGLLTIATHAYATVSVTWNTPSGGVQDSGNIPIPTNSLALLIWAGFDNTIDALDPFDPIAETGDDVILGAHNIPAPGFLTPGTTTALSENFPGLGTNDFVGGFVYVRVFNSGVPTVGSEYGESLFGTPLVDQEVTPGPQIFDITGGGTFVLTNTIVPEPSSMALLALGAGWLFSRKRRS